MTTSTARRGRWPVSALLEVTRRPIAEIAVAAGYSGRSGNRWARSGWLTDEAADRASIALGEHPAVIWPDW